MQDEPEKDAYTRLREAAIEVLNAVPKPGDPPERFESALHELRAALSGDAPYHSEPGSVVLDPFQHALARKRYVNGRARPIPLPQRAQDLRERLDGDRKINEVPPGSSNVVITDLRAMIAADLLEELAARLAPGAAFGPGHAGEDLSRLATDLAKELLAQTFLAE